MQLKLQRFFQHSDKGFEHWLFQSRLKHIRYMMFFTALLYMLYAYLESVMALTDVTERIVLHGIIIPGFLVAVYVLSYYPAYVRTMLILLMVAPVIAVWANLYLNLEHEYFPYFAPEIYLNIIWTFTMSGLMLRHSILAVSCSIAISLFMTSVLDFSPLSSYLHYLWMLSAMVFGILTAIIFERVHHSLYEQQISLAHSASVDDLTGLWKRDKLTGQFASYDNKGCGSICVSVLMLDIDYFKSVNDTFGHLAGDKVLIQFAQILQDQVDLVNGYAGRFGGEEFCVLLPNTDLKKAQGIAERLLKAVSSFEFENVGHKTVSIGVTQGDSSEDFESIVSRADQALYKAKASGRNNVQFC